MRRLHLVGILSLALSSPLLAAASARAEPATDRGADASASAPWRADRIELRPAWPDATAAARPTLDLPVRELADIEPPRAFDDDLPRAPSGSFGLSVDVGRLTLYVTSDVGGGGVTRLDAMDFESYFTTGVELRLIGGLRIFAEDFQPAFMVLGDGPEQPPPDRYWDGHQGAIGLRLQPTARLRLEAAPIFYVLSASRRPDAVGFCFSLRLAL